MSTPLVDVGTLPCRRHFETDTGRGGQVLHQGEMGTLVRWSANGVREFTTSTGKHVTIKRLRTEVIAATTRVRPR